MKTAKKIVIEIVLLAAVILFAAGSVRAADLPDPIMTPGVAVDGLTTEQVCSTKWGSDTRHVTKKMKQEVFEAYHFDVNECPLTKYKGQMVHRAELDHLICRECGGADDVRNMWPQCYEPVPADKTWQLNGANKKDALENKLHSLICTNQMSIEQAQSCIATNWVECYKQVMQ